MAQQHIHSFSLNSPSPLPFRNQPFPEPKRANRQQGKPFQLFLAKFSEIQ